MNPHLVRAAAISTLLVLASCTTAEKPRREPMAALPSEPPTAARPASPIPDQPETPAQRPSSPAPEVRSPAKLAAQERFRAQTLAAHGLYVARVQPIAEFDHYIITDVWRHDPALGPAPEIGSEWQPGQAPMRKRRSGVDAVLINVTARERGQSRAISHIAQGVIVGPNLAIDELRAAVVASQPTHPVPARMYPQPPDLDETIARADAIYLTHVDTSDGYIRYRIREVWRHRATEPAPAVGAEYLPHPPRKAPPHYGDIHSAVIIMYPRPKDGRRSVGSQQVPVINGHLWGSVSLFDLRQRVKKADEHRVPETATISAVQP